jgi:hypothetical protein
LSSSTWFRVTWIFSKLCNFVQEGGIGVFVKNSFFLKYPKTLFLNIISWRTYNITFPCQEVANFLILEIVSFSRNFGRKSYFAKSLAFNCFAVLGMILTNTSVYLQYASSALFLNLMSWRTYNITFPCQEVANFLILEIVSFSRNFGKKSYFAKSLAFNCFAVLGMILTNTSVYLQYALSALFLNLMSWRTYNITFSC